MRACFALVLVVALSGWTHAAPANLQKLEDLKLKLRALHDVLDDLNQNIDRLEARDEKRDMVPVPPEVQKPDGDTAGFINSLSPEDQEALQKMKSKMKFLQAAVHEEPGVDIPAEDGFAEEQPAKREMDPEMEELLDSLSDEDKKLLEKHPSAEKRSEDELESFVSRLSDDDKALLTRMKSKLGNLKVAIEAEKRDEADDEGTFGGVVSDQDARRSLDSGWQDAPTKCEGSDCNKPPADEKQIQEVDHVSEVKERLLEDIRYAKKSGVSLKSVLRTLMEARRNQQ